jgi:kinesin family protein C2/C3
LLCCDCMCVCDDRSASYLEIYNENIFDLLSKERESLTVKHAGGAGIEVAGLTVHSVSSVAEVQQVLDLGDSNRSTFATNMNEHSSRSHSMLSIVIESTNTVTGQSLRGKLNLVDLAGSERLSRTDATGDRLKEAQNINKSLSALGDVIASLAKKDKHTPFRNSKLTQVSETASLRHSPRTSNPPCSFYSLPSHVATLTAR